MAKAKLFLKDWEFYRDFLEPLRINADDLYNVYELLGRGALDVPSTKKKIIETIAKVI